MQVVSNRDSIERAFGHTGAPGARGVLVPTIGALHAGHLQLIRNGADLAIERGLDAGCIVSIFVNPKQFNDPTDFDKYPRMMDDDLAACEDAGTSWVVSPAVEVVYPDSGLPAVPIPDVAREPGFEDRFRPGHFDGVCRVIHRLFNMLVPQAAIFGQKDWQQLQVATALVELAGMPVDIIGHPTVREPDGLAMSSRNLRLEPEDRQRAVAISLALQRAGQQRSEPDAEAIMLETLEEHDITPEYAVIRDSLTLSRVTAESVSARALIAAPVGPVRLIDNAPWPATGGARLP